MSTFASAVRRLRPSGPPHDGPSRRRVAVVLNRRARQVDAALIKRLCGLVGAAHVYVSDTVEEAEQMARAIVHGRYDVVACGGGDGTFSGSINRVLRYVREANAWRSVKGENKKRPATPFIVPAFAFLALGTGNALAHVVGSGTPFGDLTRLLYDDELTLQQVPLIQSDAGQHFLFGGFGYDSLLQSDYNAFVKQFSMPFLRSLWGYVAAVATRTLPRVANGKPLLEATVHSIGRAWYIDPHAKDRPVPLGVDVPLFMGPADLLGFGTVAFFGYGMRVFPFAGVLPRTMHLRIANYSAARVLGVLPQLWRGTLRDAARLRDFAVEGVEVELHRPFPFEHSGDDQGDVRRIRLSLAKDPIALVMFAPASKGALPRAG